ncbi:hypothetical protein NP493_420g00002 [Ridgeia piscesae]|uniref:Ig-like domain-containing protein n=1 Tax=Ridgeia piscesae TaxID=27915 RepID=A0AAD9NVB9_RIDPI|nr:hypothetical protein NP493_420g00002 [Ridgeia piscesae]
MVGDIDITYECTRTPDVTRVNNDGLLKITNVITYTYSRTNHDIDYNSQTLSCQVKMPEYEMVEVTAVIEVQHPPVLSCGTVQNKLGAKNVQLTCTGTMYPAPDYSAWIWGKSPNTIVLKSNNQQDGFQALLRETGNGRYTFTLTIDHVTMDLFTKFKLEVANDIGLTDQIVKLVRGTGEAGADTGVASTSRTASVWTLVMSVATIIGATMLSLSSS